MCCEGSSSRGTAEEARSSPQSRDLAAKMSANTSNREVECYNVKLHTTAIVTCLASVLVIIECLSLGDLRKIHTVINNARSRYYNTMESLIKATPDMKIPPL